MKKNGLKVLSMSVLLSSLCLAGCSCSDEKPNVAEIKDGGFLSGLTSDASDYSLLDIYNAIIASDAGNKVVANELVNIVATIVLELGEDPDPDMEDKYDALVEEKLQEIKDKEDYLVNGVFSEDLFVKSLRAEGYDVTAGDYEDYINKTIRVEVLSTLLKQKYIAEETLKDSQAIVTNKKIRDVEYISISSSVEGNYDDYEENDETVEISARNFMRDIRNLIAEAHEHDSTNDIDFEQYALNFKAELEKSIEAEVKKITSEEDYSQALAAEYTANYTRSVDEGKQEKLDEIEELVFNNALLLSSDSTSNAVISETITNRLLKITDPEKAIEDKRAIQIGDWYYLVSLNAGTTVDANDILLTETSDSSTYTYSIVRFKVIDAENYEENEERVVELLAETSTLGSGAVSFYLKQYKNNITIHDDAVYAYLKTLYPDVFTD